MCDPIFDQDHFLTWILSCTLEYGVRITTTVTNCPVKVKMAAFGRSSLMKAWSSTMAWHKAGTSPDLPAVELLPYSENDEIRLLPSLFPASRVGKESLPTPSPVDDILRLVASPYRVMKFDVPIKFSNVFLSSSLEMLFSSPMMCVGQINGFQNAPIWSLATGVRICRSSSL